jgi:hypothetical protein
MFTKNAITLAAVVFIATASTGVLAWGDREQGILTGIVGAVVINEVLSNHASRGVVYPDAYQYGGRSNGRFPEFRCNGSEIDCAYERGVYDRKRQEWEDIKREAYECGRYPGRCR